MIFVLFVLHTACKYSRKRKKKNKTNMKTKRNDRKKKKKMWIGALLCVLLLLFEKKNRLYSPNDYRRLNALNTSGLSKNVEYCAWMRTRQPNAVKATEFLLSCVASMFRHWLLLLFCFALFFYFTLFYMKNSLSIFFLLSLSLSPSARFVCTHAYEQTFSVFAFVII